MAKSEPKIRGLIFFIVLLASLLFIAQPVAADIDEDYAQAYNDPLDAWKNEEGAYAYGGAYARTALRNKAVEYYCSDYDRNDARLHYVRVCAKHDLGILPSPADLKFSVTYKDAQGIVRTQTSSTYTTTISFTWYTLYVGSGVIPKTIKVSVWRSNLGKPLLVDAVKIGVWSPAKKIGILMIGDAISDDATPYKFVSEHRHSLATKGFNEIYTWDGDQTGNRRNFTSWNNWISFLDSIEDHNDQIFIHFDSHGKHINNQGSYMQFTISNSEKLYDYQLDAHIDKLEAGWIVILLDVCYAGGFYDHLPSSGRHIIVASDIDHQTPSWGKNYGDQDGEGVFSSFYYDAIDDGYNEVDAFYKADASTEEWIRTSDPRWINENGQVWPNNNPNAMHYVPTAWQDIFLVTN
ncbi:MAG: C13 family peptidase [Candidatus Hodarchaeota archaeon]